MASIELARLIAELKKAASPVQRLKLVARAWRSVRRLAPGERRDLAAEVGLEGTEELLERLASRGGSRLSPSLLLRALDRIRETEPHEVRAVVESMRDPRRRSKMMRRAVEALMPEAEPEAEPEQEVQAEPEPPPMQAESEVEPAPEPGPPPVEAEPEVEPEPPQEPERPVPVAVQPPPPPSVAARAEEPIPEPPPPSDGGLTDRITGSASPTVRFRLLRANVKKLEALDPEQLGWLVERFPPGWQRRRALSTLFRAGIPGNAQQALELIERLESDRARRWCASILLDRWTLSTHERDALIERHGLFRRRSV